MATDLPVRLFDPKTSVLAARLVMQGNGDLVDAIRGMIYTCGPQTHEMIAENIRSAWGDRWLPQTIVTACARADLQIYDTVTNARGRPVHRWTLA